MHLPFFIMLGEI